MSSKIEDFSALLQPEFSAIEQTDYRFNSETRISTDQVTANAPGYALGHGMAPLNLPSGVKLERTAVADYSYLAPAERGSDFIHASNESLAALAPIQGVFPRIVINDAVGPAGSQALAEPFAAVVALSGGCTGTLIAPDVVLSARHCGNFVGETVIFGANSNAGEFDIDVAEVFLPAGFGGLLDGGDVSILRLEGDVPASVATPMELFAASEDLVGEVAKTIGYGFNGVGSIGHQFSADGLRWAGENIIDTFGSPEAAFGENIFSTDFDDGSAFANTIPGSNQNPLPNEATTAPGDSGGPLLVEINGEYVIAGVLSGGTNAFSQYGDISWWTGIGVYETEITAAGGVFTTANPILDDHGDSIPFDATELQFDTFAVSNSIGRDTGRIGFAETPVERDVFSFVISDANRVIIDVKATTSSLDTYLELYDSDGLLIAQNNNAGSLNNPTDSQLFIRDIADGQYFVAVSGNNNTEGNYRVAVRHDSIPLQTDDVGNTFATANEVTLREYPNSTFFNASAEVGSDNDFIRFVANQTGELVVRSKALSGDLNTVLRGYNVQRQLQDGNNNFNGSLDSRIAFDVESGGVYFLRLSTVGDSAGDYRLSLRIRNGTSGELDRVRLSLDGAGHAGANSAAVNEDLAKLTQADSTAGSQWLAIA